MTGVLVRPVARGDHERWSELYAGYAASYDHPQSADDRERVWGWLHDPRHVVEGLVAEVDGRVVGLAHHRVFPRPLAAGTGAYLDDLFVDPAARRGGVARALVAEVAAVGRVRGATVVRWITRSDNAAARRLYDAVAAETSWVTYDLEL